MSAKSLKSYLQKGALLGKGAFGKVYIVTNTLNGEKYVMKELDITKDQKIEEIRNESEILKILNSNYITKYIDSFPNNEGGFNIVMEFCEGGDLANLIESFKKKKTKIPENTIIKIFIEMCLGIGYLHNNNLIHRDLKPANIFLTNDKVAKIGDLGLTKKLGSLDQYVKTFCGTLVYMSPELLLQSPYNFKSDIWSMGIILYELLTLTHPFIDSNPMVLYQKLLTGYFEPVKEDYSQPLKDFPALILKPDMKERPDTKAILKNDFLITKAKDIGILPEVVNFLGQNVQSCIFKNNDIDIIKKMLLDDIKMNPNLFDFSKNNQDGGWAQDVEKRGGFDYYPPHGWYGIGLNTNVLYPGTDDSWLGTGRFADSSEWAVAYHGLRRGGKFTIKQKIQGIILGGLKEGPNQDKRNDDDLLHPGKKCGTGVFHYYNIKDLIYNGNVSPDESGYLFIFMCRVLPEKIRQPKSNPSMWLLNGTKEETRPYRLLFRRVHLIKK